MKKLALIIAPLLFVGAGMAQSRSCLRTMPIDELIRSSIWIGRVKVQKINKATFRGAYSQLATLKAVDVIDGNFSLLEVPVLAKSNVPCAADVYVKEQEMLVFLAPESSLFRTQNFQFGQFVIVGELVKGWRDRANNLVDLPYADVRKEIETYLKAIRHQQEPAAPPGQKPIKPPPQKPGLQ
jgi:hypothetical protein